MKGILKFLALVLFTIALLVSTAASAAPGGIGEQGSTAWSSDNYTGKLFAQTSWTNAASTNVLFVAGKDLNVQFVFAYTGAGTEYGTNKVFTSVDKVNWTLINTMSAAGNGATAVSVMTNLTINAVPWVKFETGVGNATGATNSYVKWFTK